MSDLNEILNALYKADLVIEEVDPDFSKSKLVGEQTSSMARMKEKHRDENDRIRTKHEREIDAAQRRERNRQRTQRQG